MSASEFQQQNLNRMTQILGRSLNARILAGSLWHFFEFRLACRLPQIDKDKPSSWHIEIEQFVRSNKPGDLAPELVIRDTARREEALVHELLHLNLIPLGYPRFRIWEDDEAKWNLAANIINKADHSVMLPTFISLGYAEDKFLGPSCVTALGHQVDEDFKMLEPQVRTPKEYGYALGNYFKNHSIRHEVVWIAELIQAANGISRRY